MSIFNSIFFFLNQSKMFHYYCLRRKNKAQINAMPGNSFTSFADECLCVAYLPNDVCVSGNSEKYDKLILVLRCSAERST